MDKPKVLYERVERLTYDFDDTYLGLDLGKIQLFASDGFTEGASVKVTIEVIK